MFAGRFSYLVNNFYITVGAVGSSFSPSLPEVRGKINFLNMLANTMFVSAVRKCIRSLTFNPHRINQFYKKFSLLSKNFQEIQGS